LKLKSRLISCLPSLLPPLLFLACLCSAALPSIPPPHLPSVLLSIALSRLLPLPSSSLLSLSLLRTRHLPSSSSLSRSLQARIVPAHGELRYFLLRLYLRLCMLTFLSSIHGERRVFHPFGRSSSPPTLLPSSSSLGRKASSTQMEVVISDWV